MGSPVTPAQADFLRRLCRTHGVAEPPAPETGESARAYILRIIDGDLGGNDPAAPTDPTLAGITPWQVATIIYYCEKMWGDPFPSELYPIIEKAFSKLLCVTDLSRRQASRIIVELDKLEHP